MRQMLIETSVIGGLRALARDAARRLPLLADWSLGLARSTGRSTGGPAGRSRENERGDVPGWVLITLMTAGLVLLLWALAGPALTGVFTTAINNVQTTIG